MKGLSKHYVLFCLAAGLPGMAGAQSLTGNVGSANITAGDRAAEVRLGTDDTGLVQGRLHMEHAFSGWYQLRAIAAFRKPDDADWDYSGLTLENWFQWAEEGKDERGFNGGLRLAYTWSDGGDADEVAARLTLTDRFADNWEWRANIIAGADISSSSPGGVDLESRFQISRAVRMEALGTDKWRFGGELFSEFGNSSDLLPLEEQAHQAGPVVKAEWANGVYLQAAVRAGLTDGSDDLMGKIFIGREF
jgi:hypothetical protein